MSDGERMPHFVESAREAWLPQRGLRHSVRSMARDVALRLVAQRQPARENFIRCLYSHAVFPDTREAFRAFIRRTRNVGEFVDTQGLLALLSAEKPEKGRYFHLSFDDGFANVYEEAGSVLEDMAVPYAIFVATDLIGADEEGKKIAIPGTMTTAYLALKLFEPDFEHVVMPFDKILQAVKDHEVDGGLIIHEGQLTFGQDGLHNVIELGKWFKAKYGLPLPLGANALRRDLSPEVQAECSRLMRESIQYSLDHREEALNYAMQFARDLDAGLADQFVGMYVNHHTIDGGDIVPQAAQKLLDLGFEAGLIPYRTTVEVVR